MCLWADGIQGKSSQNWHQNWQKKHANISCICFYKVKSVKFKVTNTIHLSNSADKHNKYSPAASWISELISGFGNWCIKFAQHLTYQIYHTFEWFIGWVWQSINKNRVTRTVFKAKIKWREARVHGFPHNSRSLCVPPHLLLPQGQVTASLALSRLCLLCLTATENNMAAYLSPVQIHRMHPTFQVWNLLRYPTGLKM